MTSTNTKNSTSNTNASPKQRAEASEPVAPAAYSSPVRAPAGSSKLTMTLEDLQQMVAIVKGQIRQGAKSDQTVSFARIGTGADEGKIFPYDKSTFKYMQVECDGPILPYEKKVGNVDYGPKRPMIKAIHSPGAPEYPFAIHLDQLARAAYEFNKTKLREAFPELLTFTFQRTLSAPTRTSPQGRTVYEVMVVTHKGEVGSLSEYLPASLNAAQQDAIGQIEKDKRLLDVECVDEKGEKYKTFTFANLEPRIDAKSKKIYQEFHIAHSSYPDGIRQYRSDQNPYRPFMSDINQWGIVIPRMVANESGGYSPDNTTDWVKEPGFRAVTKLGERNPFVGRIGFTVDSIMEGGGNVKVWYRADKVWLMPQKSSAAADDFGEEPVAAPTGPIVSLNGQSKAMAANNGLTGKTEMGDGDEM